MIHQLSTSGPTSEHRELILHARGILVHDVVLWNRAANGRDLQKYRFPHTGVIAPMALAADILGVLEEEQPQLARLRHDAVVGRLNCENCHALEHNSPPAFAPSAGLLIIGYWQHRRPW